jgi:hypothetical protein
MITNIRLVVSIDAESPQAAYEILCGTLAITADDAGNLEYTTETYTTDSDNTERDTREFWNV